MVASSENARAAGTARILDEPGVSIGWYRDGARTKLRAALAPKVLRPRGSALTDVRI
nr:hypothetical protein JVH1_0814 [Rhodococcus sp. JVH1]